MTTAPRRLLVVEDDPAIRRGVVAALTFAGYDVLEAGDGPRGLALAEAAEVDLVLLDVVLPGTDGLEILRRVRESRPTRPVILLTARAAEDDRVGGLAAGADDYVVKPFSVRELLARVEAVLRRSPERPRPVELIECDGLVVDLARREIRHADGGRVELSEKEAELAAYLAAHAGRAISREELLRRVWRLDPRGVTTRTIDMHVMRLREKLRDDTAAPRRVLTVRGQGYAWAAAEAGE
ncbi:MAG: response regulator transcription factor [Planctomycetaceae bacterium]|jgi:two-component system alkaline phosphatase synthesis response regulator PhoP|nr:response regulator transcription factor [Planctomycetaceae bacterium]